MELSDPAMDSWIDLIASRISSETPTVRTVELREDVANAVLFFASPHSSFVTGQTLYVCGGSSVGTVPV
jgi:3-oxoacyl-[acyl-carrier protein] reductase